MKLYSDRLVARDIYDAANAAGGIYLASFQAMPRPKLRARGWNVVLASETSNRRRNSGTHGASGDTAGTASWDDHGRFFAALFAVDANARLAMYNGAEEFLRQTCGRYPISGGDFIDGEAGGAYVLDAETGIASPLTVGAAMNREGTPDECDRDVIVELLATTASIARDLAASLAAYVADHKVGRRGPIAAANYDEVAALLARAAEVTK